MDLSNTGEKYLIRFSKEDLGKLPYTIDPSRSDYLQIVKHPISTYPWEGKTFYAVRMGIPANSEDLWMWPGDIMHRIAAKHIAKLGDQLFKYKFQYTKNYPDRLLTDTPHDFDVLTDEQKKALTLLIQKKIGWLGTKGISGWDEVVDGGKDEFLVNFSDYVKEPFVKDIPSDDEDEPEYARVIRRFHNMESVNKFDSLLKENDNMTSLDGKFITRLINYLDGLFPSYGNLDQNISVELKNIMKDNDSKDIQKVKKKIHNILMRCKSKLLTKVKDQVERINIKSKDEELTEMPHGVVNNKAIDFKMELPGWNKRMIELINTTDDVNKLMEPFYDLSYIQLFQKKFALLSPQEKEELVKVLPMKFKQDTGIMRR
jgi:hypothetical protein